MSLNETLSAPATEVGIRLLAPIYLRVIEGARVG
jgi:hypothetical protein